MASRSFRFGDLHETRNLRRQRTTSIRFSDLQDRKNDDNNNIQIDYLLNNAKTTKQFDSLNNKKEIHMFYCLAYDLTVCKKATTTRTTKNYDESICNQTTKTTKYMIRRIAPYCSWDNRCGARAAPEGRLMFSCTAYHLTACKKATTTTRTKSQKVMPIRLYTNKIQQQKLVIYRLGIFTHLRVNINIISYYLVKKNTSQNYHKMLVIESFIYSLIHPLWNLIIKYLKKAYSTWMVKWSL